MIFKNFSTVVFLPYLITQAHRRMEDSIKLIHAVEDMVQFRWFSVWPQFKYNMDTKDQRCKIIVIDEALFFSINCL